MKKTNSSSAKCSISEKIFDLFNHIVLTLFGFTTVYPFWYALIYSLNAGSDSEKGGLYFYPRVFTLKNYTTVLKDQLMANAFFISVMRTLVGTTLTVLLCSMTAYAFTKKDMPGRNFFTIFIFITTLFGGGMIPFFILIRWLGLYNTFWVYIIPGLYSFWNIVVMRTYMQNLPMSIEESALIDGAGYLRIYFQIILPLSMPVIAYFLLIIGVGHWNDWFSGLFYVTDKKLMPAQSVIQNLIRSSSFSAEVLRQGGAIRIEEIKVTSESLKMAAIMLVTIPIICIYPFLQKYFVKGALIGSVKG